MLTLVHSVLEFRCESVAEGADGEEAIEVFRSQLS